MSYSQQLLDHPSFIKTQDINDICAPLSAFNISWFANARINARGEFSSLCNYPEFLLHYLEKNFHRADISAKEEWSDIGNYVMWDILACRGATANMLEDAAAFHYKHIFTVIEKKEHHIDFYHFGTQFNFPAINQWYLNNLEKLKSFIDFFNDKAAQSRELAKAHLITFPIVQPSQCLIDLKLEEAAHALSSKMTKSHAANALSHRQHQCLELLCKGLTAKEIGKHLNLSFRTVEDHISILKSKFGAKNSGELIAKGMFSQIKNH